MVVSDFKYLGIILDSNLTFKKHVKRWLIPSDIIWLTSDT